MHRLFAEAIALGVKTVLVGAYLVSLVRREELAHLPSSFAMVDLAKEAWLRDAAAVLQSADPLAYARPTADRFSLN